MAIPKFAAQAIRKSFDLGWNATRYITNVSVSIATVLKPAGLDKSKGLITGGYVLDVTDPRYKDEPSLKAWKEFTDKYMSAKEYNDVNASYAFGAAATMIQVLKQCGNDLSRENVMKEAANLEEFRRAALDSGHHDQHLARQFQPDPPIAAAHLQRDELVAVRGDFGGLNEKAARVLARGRYSVAPFGEAFLRTRIGEEACRAGESVNVKSPKERA